MGQDTLIANRKDTEKGRKDSLRENGSGELPDLSTEEDIEEEEGSSWDAARIMRMVIVVLIVAIVIEFAVIGVKLFAPNSQGAVFINRIEQSLSGEEAAYLSAPHLSGEEDSIVMDQ